MRTELQEIERIERYLEGKLSSGEKAEFEKQMTSDPAFKKLVQDQKSLMAGVDRSAFKSMARKRFKLFKRKQKLWKWGLGGAITIIALAVAIPLFLDMENINRFTTDEEVAEWRKAEIQVAVATESNFSALEKQSFVINTTRDTVIETKEGLVFDIPKGAFVNAEGDEVTENVELNIREAVTSTQIVSSGLTTTSDGKLLETGGMFHISAKANGESLNLKKDITAQVPQSDFKPGMLLFNGEKDKDGNVNWVDPQEIENWLTPVDITTLDFYPPGYEAKLDELGYGDRSKEWKDSLYFSFAASIPEVSDRVMVDSVEYGPEGTFIRARDKDGYMVYSEDSIWMGSEGADESAEDYAIDPSKIKAIWNKKYNNTNLATKEFQMRLQLIFSICSHEALDLYVNNLDKNLWEVDEMAAAAIPSSAEQFKKLAARKDGRVELSSKAAKRLSRYYAKKQDKIKKKTKEIQERFQAEQNRLSREWNEASEQQAVSEYKRDKENLTKEYEKNLKEVYDQLGYETKASTAPTVITVSVSSVGAKNIDRYVRESTEGRNSVEIHENGKTAKIEYFPKYVQVDEKESYDRIYSYVLSNELYSFQRMEDTTGGFTFKLNGFMEYNIAVVAYRGDSCFFGKIKGVDLKKASEHIELKPMSEKRLKPQLDRLAGGSKKSFKQDIIEDLVYQKKKLAEQARQQQRMARELLMKELLPIVFPCKDFPYCGWMSESVDPRETGRSFRMFFTETGKILIDNGGGAFKDEGMFHFVMGANKIFLSEKKCHRYTDEEAFDIEWLEGNAFQILTLWEVPVVFRYHCEGHKPHIIDPCEGPEYEAYEAEIEN